MGNIPPEVARLPAEVRRHWRRIYQREWKPGSDGHTHAVERAWASVKNRWLRDPAAHDYLPIKVRR